MKRVNIRCLNYSLLIPLLTFYKNSLIYIFSLRLISQDDSFTFTDTHTQAKSVYQVYSPCLSTDVELPLGMRQIRAEYFPYLRYY